MHCKDIETFQNLQRTLQFAGTGRLARSTSCQYDTIWLKKFGCLHCFKDADVTCDGMWTGQDRMMHWQWLCIAG